MLELKWLTKLEQINNNNFVIIIFGAIQSRHIFNLHDKLSLQFESKTPQNTSPKVFKTCMGLNHFEAIGFSVIHFEN